MDETKVTTPEPEISVEPEAPSAPVDASVKEAETSIEAQTTNETSNIDLIPTDHYLTSPLFHEIANYFGIESGEYDNAADKLSVITDYVINKIGSNKVEDVMVEIRKLEDLIQPPAWGEKRYNNVYRYLRLAVKRDAFSKALTAFERKVANRV